MSLSRGQLHADLPGQVPEPSFRAAAFETNARAKNNRLRFADLYNSQDYRLPAHGMIEWRAENSGSLDVIFAWNEPTYGLDMSMTQEYPSAARADFVEPCDAMRVESFRSATVVTFGRFMLGAARATVEPVDAEWHVSERNTPAVHGRLICEHIDKFVARKISEIMQGEISVAEVR